MADDQVYDDSEIRTLLTTTSTDVKVVKEQLILESEQRKMYESKTDASLQTIDVKLKAHDEYNAKCESEHQKSVKQHEEHSIYRRENDDKVRGMYVVLTEIRDILKDYKDQQPTIKRVQNNYTTIDTLKIWAGYLAIGYIAWTQIKELFL